ncbi:hypothetical protein E4T48_06634 [Aureobasidium sp. EXF-10727]|nr:hypothetical protein E4T48_06634 [Aureobasidium sp. EXF-10727]
MSNNQTPIIYPPGAVPIARPTMAPSGAPTQSALAPGASRNLLQALTAQNPPTIQRPVFAAPRKAPMPAGYPAPVYVDPTMIRIKHMTETFHAAATNDQTFYSLYCGVRGSQSHDAAYPNLVFFLRLHLQVGWLDLLERHHRQNEVQGDTAHLIHERKKLIEWLVQQDKTLKPRAGQYLAGQLAKFAPLNFDPSQVSPLNALLDHLYVLENDRFFNPEVIPAPTRQEYRIQVVTYLNYEGGDAQIVKDVNIWKKTCWLVVERMLSALTQNIQAAQFAYNYGWQEGGYRGNWTYWVSESGTPEGWSHELFSEAHLEEMKTFLEQGKKIYIMHSKQVEIGEQLQVADALGLGLDRPFEWCAPLPPGYTSVIMGEYPNKMDFSLLSGGSVGGGPAPEMGPRRGARSELFTQHRFWLRKQKQKQQKARAFEIRGKKA